MENMKLYLIEQDQCTGYDTYDSAVVRAPDEETARRTHPYKYRNISLVKGAHDYGDWPTDPQYVRVTYLGDAVSGAIQGVVCASFNAG
jgi:hypothetical protein